MNTPPQNIHSPPKTDNNKIKEQNSLTESIFPVIALIIGLLTSACYAIGRARLLGWHEAAGIPQLSFSWPIQDVILFGFLAIDRWLYFVTAISAAIIWITFQISVTDYIDDLFIPIKNRINRGENLSQLRLRNRFANTARDIRLGRTPGNYSDARSRHLVLGPRGRTKSLKKNAKKALLRRMSFIAFGVLSTGSLIIIYIAYLAISWFILAEYRAGKESSLDDKNKALAAFATAEIPKTDKKDKNTTQIAKVPIVSGNIKLPPYTYVKILSEIKLNQNPMLFTACGWLVQSTNSQILIFRSSGIQLINFGDQSYTWFPVVFGSCKSDEL